MIKNSAPELPADAYLSWVEVYLPAIRANYRMLRNHVPAAVEMFPVVKADAYGHGAVAVTRALVDEGATRVCVARVEEAVELREAGIDVNILVFGPPFTGQALVAARYGLEAVACDTVHLDAIEEAQKATGKPIPVHLKFDIGMGRIGARPDTAVEMYLDCIKRGIQVIGIMSHFPCADAADATITEPMVGKFNQVCHDIMAAGGSNLYFHTSNTAAALRFSDAHFNAVRCGISLYGQYPSLEMPHDWHFSPAMSLKTRIIFIKEVPAGTPVSYCQTWHTERASRLATLALGYADGYPRHASSKSQFMVRGQLVPQVGRVCMDQLVIDVTDVPEAAIGDEVLAFGVTTDGRELRAEVVADMFGSIGYELTTRIGKRLPRFYPESAAPPASAPNAADNKQ